MKLKFRNMNILKATIIIALFLTPFIGMALVINRSFTLLTYKVFLTIIAMGGFSATGVCSLQFNKHKKFKEFAPVGAATSVVSFFIVHSVFGEIFSVTISVYY